MKYQKRDGAPHVYDASLPEIAYGATLNEVAEYLETRGLHIVRLYTHLGRWYAELRCEATQRRVNGAAGSGPVPTAALQDALSGWLEHIARQPFDAAPSTTQEGNNND